MLKHIESAKKSPIYTYLFILVLVSVVGLQGWRTLFNNYAVDVIGVTGFQIGLAQLIREIPGFMAMLVVYVLLIVKEHRLAAISIFLLGIGVAISGAVTTFSWLLFSIFIMSLGFHYFETINQSLTLQYFTTEEAPHVFARFKKYGALTNIITGLVVWMLAMVFTIQQNFMILGVFVSIVGVLALIFDPIKKDAVKSQKRKFIFRKKYWLYYVINLFAGARRQIFVVFAVFLLVQKYQFSVQDVSILFILNNIIAYFIMPKLGKAISRFGEKKVLSLEYFSLFFIFLGYAFIPNKYVIALLYVLDHIFFGFAIAIKTYFQKTADKEDIASSVAVSFTINHTAALFIPIIGGALWMLHWQLPFIIGAVLSLVSLFFISKIQV